MGAIGEVFGAFSASGALTTTDAVLTLGAGSDSAPVPDRARLSLLRLALTSISGATSISWYLAEDAAGDVPLTPRVSSTIQTGKTTATSGGVAETLDVSRLRSSAGTIGRLYVVAKTDSGTATAVAYLTGEQR